MFRGLSLFGVIFLFCSSCSFTKPYEVNLVSDKRPPGEIIGILSSEGNFKIGLFLPVILEDQRVTVYKDPLLQKLGKSIDLPGRVLSYYIKNDYSLMGVSKEYMDSEYNNIYLMFLCCANDTNVILSYMFDFNELKNGNVNETKSAIFPTKADKIISFSRNDKNNAALLICQSDDSKFLYITDPWGETEHIKSLETPMLFADWKYNQYNPISMIGYNGKIVYFYRFSGDQLFVDFKVDLRSEGDLSKTIIKDMNYLDNYGYGSSFSLYDGKKIHLIDLSTNSVVYSREFPDEVFTKQLNYKFFFSKEVAYYIGIYDRIDNHSNNTSDFVAKKLFLLNYSPLSIYRTPEYESYYFCQYNPDSTLVYDMQTVRDNQNKIFKKHSYREIPGKVVKALFSSYKAYFYTEDSVWECDYMNSEEGQYELIKMNLGPEYEEK